MEISSRNVSGKLPQIIGIAGMSGSGKDTIASYLCSRYENVWTEHFADPLKRACAHAFGIPLENFHHPSLKTEINKYWGVTPRMIAQFIGTEMFRNTVDKLTPIGSDFWVKRMKGRLTGATLLPEDDFYYGDGTYEEEDLVVIADVRFQNEIDMIQGLGGIMIDLRRPGTPVMSGGLESHVSENLSTLRYNPETTWLTINNETLVDLYGAVDRCIKFFVQKGVLHALKLKTIDIQDL